MSKREVTTDLGLGLGLVRWGDHRRDVAACYPDASYGICENIYAFQRIFFVDDLFAGTQPELAGIGAYVEPSAPEVIFDEVPHAHARAFLDAIGCPLAVNVDEATWRPVRVRSPSVATTIPPGSRCADPPGRGRGPRRRPALRRLPDSAEDDTWEPDYEAFKDDEG